MQYIKYSLDDHLNDIRMDLDLIGLRCTYGSFSNFVVDANNDVEDYRLKLADDLYDAVDQLIWKYEESFRIKNNA